MKKSILSRRSFVKRSVGGVSAAMAIPSMGPVELFAAEGNSSGPVSLIHQTDLFRPHADPDDHFDLAGLLMPATGSLSPAGQAPGPAPCRFVQAQIECDDQGRTRWQPVRSTPARYKFEVTDCANYAKAMI